MSVLRLCSLAAIAGLSAPAILVGCWYLVNSRDVHWLADELFLERITLMLWPSSFALVAGYPSLGWNSFGLTVATNVAIYVGLAALIWFGLNRSKLIFSVPLLVIGTIWSWAILWR